MFCDEYGAGVYCVLDRIGAGARREITRKVPPQVRFFTKFRTTTIFYIAIFSREYLTSITFNTILRENVLLFNKKKVKYSIMNINNINPDLSISIIPDQNNAAAPAVATAPAAPAA